MSGRRGLLGSETLGCVRTVLALGGLAPEVAAFRFSRVERRGVSRHLCGSPARGRPRRCPAAAGTTGAAGHLEEALGGACPFGVSPRSLEKGLGRCAGRAARGSALLVARPSPREPGRVGIDVPVPAREVPGGTGTLGSGSPGRGCAPPSPRAVAGAVGRARAAAGRDNAGIQQTGGNAARASLEGP